MTQVGFPPGTIYAITGITRARPGVVTLASVADQNAFPVALGQTVTISKVLGMIQINDLRFLVGGFDPDAKTFNLIDLYYNTFDTSSFSVYTGGGQINIISYAATATQPDGLMYNNQDI